MSNPGLVVGSHVRPSAVVFEYNDTTTPVVAPSIQVQAPSSTSCTERTAEIFQNALEDLEAGVKYIMLEVNLDVLAVSFLGIGAALSFGLPYLFFA